MAKNKFYVVKIGRKTGIYKTWAECEANVKGVKNAEFKSFATLNEAKAFLGENVPQNKHELPSENEIFAYTDGSYNIKTGVYGYGVVLIFHDGTELVLDGNDNNKELSSMRNVAGELKGACVAMQYAYRNNFNALTIYYDYEGIAKWACGLWKTNLEYTKKYAEYASIIRKKLELRFKKVEAHTGVYYNEKVDMLAKKAAGIL